MFLVNPNPKQEALFHGTSQTVAFQDFEGFSFCGAGFLPRSVGQRHPRVSHERHHVPDLRTVAAVLQGSVGTRNCRGWRAVASVDCRASWEVVPVPQSPLWSGTEVAATLVFFNIKQRSDSLKLSR